MKLIEALNIARTIERRAGAALPCFLAAGFNALHLKAFLSAELGHIFPERKIEVNDGLFGDLSGNIERLARSNCELGIVLIEWPDLDPRLGVRNTARWADNQLSDILTAAKTRALLIQNALDAAGQRIPLVVSLPTLPLLPFAFTPSWQVSSFEAALHAIVHSFTSAFFQSSRVRVLNSQRLDQDSPLKDRHDVEADVLTGFPYRISHASILASLIARLAQRPTPKKGLITDLDDTMWRGILGEEGVDGISWDLEHRSQMHAFYQRFLGALMSEGVMVGIASKNDPTLVEEALQRSDLALSPSSIYPVEANWKPKSQSVARILETWNVNADSVVFVDDSPLELAEVKAAHSQIECLQFPTNDSGGIYCLIRKLRDLFGRSAVSEEDSLRTQSIRRSKFGVTNQQNESAERFLEQTDAKVSFNFSKTPFDARALDLVNKTNQFNLNGNRYTEAAWGRFLEDPESLLIVVSYQDKFGPLGKIAVIGGNQRGRTLVIHTWVMSCRAFSRRIEYRCLAELADRFEFGEMEFKFQQTQRNGPLREFLGEILDSSPSPNCTMKRERLEDYLKFGMNPQEVSNG